MRKAKLFSHEAIIPRMSWSAHNLYNLIARSTVPFHVAGTDFSRTALTMYQQRWRAKRFLRGYHGDWIPERRFKRWFLPVDLPKLASSVAPGNSGASSSASSSTSATHLPSRNSNSGFGPRSRSGDDAASERSQMPTASLFMSEVERRLDVVVFRCCFARSAYEARSMIVHGKVQLNGQKVSDPNRLLNPGDLISVAPDAIPMLSKVLKQRAARRENAKRKASGAPAKKASPPPSTSEDAATVTASSEEKEADTPAGEGKEEEVETSTPESQTDKSESASATDDKSTTSPPSNKESGGKGKGKAKASSESESSSGPPESRLPPGVRTFTLPAFAAPFLFIPSYLEPSFTTCSAIYLRHPTIVPSSSSSSSNSRYAGSSASSSPEFLSEIPSPYPASGDIFSMAWEHYARTAPRVRGDLRRLQLKAKVGTGSEVGGAGGMERERAKIVWKRMRAVRKGWARAGGAAVPNKAKPPVAKRDQSQRA
ncbi:unnamed protein product [Tilletia controversa]|nr:unnamed protein product [Tilletia controversa]